MTQAQGEAVFRPPAGQILFIVGQDLGAVGGLPGYADGYVDHIGVVPGGITTYTSLTNLAGLETLANWGSGDVHAQLIMDEAKFADSVLVIGLWMADNHEVQVAAGQYDAQIDRLGEWIKAQHRPVFIRIGYEFDGEWNHYEPAAYIRAFQRIVERLRALEVDNAVTVWQSATHHSPHYGGHEWLHWYPGDEYVDWFGLSYFEPHREILSAFVDLARAHDKPVMIAESTPRGASVAATSRPALLWQTWYQPFFDFIYANRDVIQAVAYINVAWDEQPMWMGGGWGDSRIQANSVIQERWLAEITRPQWLHADEALFTRLGYRPDGA